MFQGARGTIGGRVHLTDVTVVKERTTETDVMRGAPGLEAHNHTEG